MFEPVIEKDTSLRMVEEFEDLLRRGLEFGYLANRKGNLQAVEESLDEIYKRPQVYANFLDRRALSEEDFMELLEEEKALEFCVYLACLYALGRREYILSSLVELGPRLGQFEKRRIFEFFLSYYESYYQASSAASYLGIDGELILTRRRTSKKIIGDFRATSYGQLREQDDRDEAYYKLLNYILGLPIYSNRELLSLGTGFNRQRLPARHLNIIYERDQDLIQGEVMELIDFFNKFHSYSDQDLARKKEDYHGLLHRYPELVAYKLDRMGDDHLQTLIFEYLTNYLYAKDRFLMHLMVVNPKRAILEDGVLGYLARVRDPEYAVNYLLMSIITRLYNREMNPDEADLLFARVYGDAEDYVSDYVLAIYNRVLGQEADLELGQDILARLPNLIANSLEPGDYRTNPYIYLDPSGNKVLKDREDRAYIRYCEMIASRFGLPIINRPGKFIIEEGPDQEEAPRREGLEDWELDQIIRLARTNPDFLDFSWILPKIAYDQLDAFLRVLDEEGVRIGLDQVTSVIRQDAGLLKKINRFID